MSEKERRMSDAIEEDSPMALNRPLPPEATQATPQLASPSQVLPDRLSFLQVVFVCLGFGLYKSQKSDSQLDLSRLATWLNSPMGKELSEEYGAAIPEPPSWMGLALIALVIWAFYEATAFPRYHKMSSLWDQTRMLMQLIGDLMFAPLFLFLPGEVTEVHCTPTLQNERLLAACPSMWRFKQTPWFRNPMLCFAMLMYYDNIGNDRNQVHRERLTAPDGGTIALDWWGCGRPGANGNSKVLFIASTWTGDSLNSFSREVCKHFTSKGWQCVVMVKRGCGIAFPNEQPQLEGTGARPAPWCLNGFEDFELAVNHVAETCPGASICGLGPSLGASQLRNYVNKKGSKSKLAAAVVVDAGEDWEFSIPDLGSRTPFIASVLKVAAASSLNVCGVPQPGASKAPEFQKAASNGSKGKLRMIWELLTKTLATKQAQEPEGELWQYLRDHHAPALGFEASNFGLSKYLRSCMTADPAGCKVPTLELLSFNDVLIPVDTVRDLQKLPLASPHIVTCATRVGTHVLRWSGLRGSCWIGQVSCEFLESVLRSKAEHPPVLESDIADGLWSTTGRTLMTPMHKKRRRSHVEHGVVAAVAMGLQA
jgi:predicted alpha/beta-fold hydrolase